MPFSTISHKDGPAAHAATFSFGDDRSLRGYRELLHLREGTHHILLTDGGKRQRTMLWLIRKSVSVASMIRKILGFGP